jgi:SecD/SecF fusion protein
MLIGVLVGTYSSLCIGTPVLVDFYSKKGKNISQQKLEPVKG